MRTFLLLLSFLSSGIALQAQTARDDIRKNIYLAGSNYIDYNRQLPDFKYTKAPRGYVPFYMSHYGRHGSRWLIDPNSYTNVINPLLKAHEEDKLTSLGERTLNQLKCFEKTTHKRFGDLTTVGERQHHDIGRRMTEHFPEIFVKTKGVQIDARSTTVNRCILSMVAECEELMAANPTARIHNDVSESLQYYLNQPREGRVKENRHKADSVLLAFRDQHTHPERLMQALFNDAEWASKNIDAPTLMRQLFEVVINMQSHDNRENMTDLFTFDELYDMWRIQNAGWYKNYGPSPLSEGVMPFSQYNLLTNIIQTADTCVALRKPQATLRFGHEVCVLPLACLMELDSCGVVVERLEDVEYHWQNYKIFPMACNIQLIFYKPKRGQGDVLVKALLNEREATLPVKTNHFPYYRWEDVRKYWLKKLDSFK